MWPMPPHRVGAMSEHGRRGGAHPCQCAAISHTLRGRSGSTGPTRQGRIIGIRRLGPGRSSQDMALTGAPRRVLPCAMVCTQGEAIRCSLPPGRPAGFFPRGHSPQKSLHTSPRVPLVDYWLRDPWPLLSSPGCASFDRVAPVDLGQPGWTTRPQAPVRGPAARCLHPPVGSPGRGLAVTREVMRPTYCGMQVRLVRRPINRQGARRA